MKTLEGSSLKRGAPNTFLKLKKTSDIVLDMVVLGFQMSDAEPRVGPEATYIALAMLDLMGVEELPSSQILIYFVPILQHSVPNHTSGYKYPPSIGVKLC